MHFDFSLSWGTLASLGTFVSVVTFGWKLLKFARSLSEKLGIIHWEHEVMWLDWSSKNPVPKYPSLRHDQN